MPLSNKLKAVELKTVYIPTREKCLAFFGDRRRVVLYPLGTGDCPIRPRICDSQMVPPSNFQNVKRLRKPRAARRRGGGCGTGQVVRRSSYVRIAVASRFARLSV